MKILTITNYAPSSVALLMTLDQAALLQCQVELIHRAVHSELPPTPSDPNSLKALNLLPSTP